MKFIWILSLLIATQFLISAFAQEPASPKFTDSVASDVYSSPGNEFDAKRALQPGSGYWCSNGSHSDDDEVTWTGTLKHGVHVKGIKIRWAYSPEEVQVSVSSDAENFHVAVPFKRTPSTDVAFDENIFFDHPEQAVAVTISMKKAIHDYFGINEVTLIGSGEPLIMIVAGITSPTADMCLQSEAGKYNVDGTAVVLDSCISSLAAGDGRELWRVNDNQQLVMARSVPPRCATLQDDGGKIVLVECTRALEESDGRSNWSFEGNSQLRLQKPGSYCLSQKNRVGSAAGLGDVMRSEGVTAKCSSNADGHGAQMAADGNVETYWASGGFEDSQEHFVSFDVDLGAEYKLTRVRVDWEFPAYSYMISTSSDGQSYVEQSGSRANPANVTLDTLGGASAQHVKFELRQPHPRYGKNGDKYLYGIREIEVFANRLQSVVADCAQAANSDDARDKYFADFVTEFDPVLADKVGSIDDDLESRLSEIEESCKSLEELVPACDTCLTEKQAFSSRLHAAVNATDKISFMLEDATKTDPQANQHIGLADGDLPSMPAEECFSIKRLHPNAVSGFYWIEPKCAPEPIRVYCDMETGTSVYVWNGTPPRQPNTKIQLSSVEDVRLHCAEVGLEPLVIKSSQQLSSLYNSMRQLGYTMTGEGALPLAFDYSCLQGRCSGKYHDLLDGVTDLTSLLSQRAASVPPPSRGTNTAGLGFDRNKVIFFDIGSEPVMAIACSTNTMLDESEMPHADISCETTAEHGSEFAGVLNTNVVVDCPPGCQDVESAEVYGSGRVFADKSSICRSAIHAGLIKQGGLVNVALETALKSYEGSKQNGITSKSLDTKTIRSIRLGPVAKDCPIDSFETAPSSFIETKSIEQNKSNIGTPSSKAVAEEVDPAVASVIEKTLDLIDEIHGVDPNVVAAAQQQTSEVIAEARKRLKPAEVLQKKQEGHALQIYDNTEDLASRLYDTSGELYNTLDGLNSKLAEISELESLETGFQSFKLDYSAHSLSETWDIHDCPRSQHGPSDWAYVAAPDEDHSHALGQRSSIRGLSNCEGTIALLKHHRFYDTVFTVDFRASGSGNVGILFRAKDSDNHYSFEMNQAEGFKRLVKVVDGERTILALLKDGGYLQGKWFHIRIETTRGNIKICAGDGKFPANVFNVLDESFLSGTIGFSSSGIRDGALFDKIHVEAKPCTKFSKLAPPRPPRCSHFKDSYFQNFRVVYHQVDPMGNGAAAGSWTHKTNIGGRKKVLVQLNSVEDRKEIGSMAILKGHRLCKDGYFSADFFPECPGGIVGAVFRYENPNQYSAVEVTATEFRVQNVVDGLASTISRSHTGFTPNKWHSVVLNFEGPTLVAKLLSEDGNEATINSEDIFGSQARDGRVGLSAFNCGGVAFDNIELSPFEISKIRHTSPHGAQNIPWHDCATIVHFLQRRDKCHMMLKNEPAFRQVSCTHDFCGECCAWHTSLLKSSDNNKCKEACTANDEAASKTASAFLETINECTDAEGGVYNECSAGDSGCKLEFCHMCCKTNKNISSNTNSNESRRELSECQYQCGKEFRDGKM